MYHYVRELRRSRFPAIKGLETNEFRQQIAYVKKHYNVVSGDELLAAAQERAWDALPPAPLLLTFDDGYADHYTNVFPILQREQLTGCFFPTVKCVLEGHVLDVNKIHFVLACVRDKNALVNQILAFVDEHGPRRGLPRSADYWTKLAAPSRYDSKEVAFIKRMLQRELPVDLRRLVVDQLFRTHVSADEAAFARELYMNVDQLVCMREAGMYIGGHGYSHSSLDALDASGQEREVRLMLDFLRRVGTSLDGWMMCYPHGGYDDTLLSLLRRKQCRVGLTTRVGIADLQRDKALTLPRLNTNDLPRVAAASPNVWTLQAISSRA